MNNLTVISNALGKHVNFGYDDQDRLTSVTNELSKVWNLTLNANGWQTQLVDPNTHTNQYGYDHGGNLTNWANGLAHTYDYYANGWLQDIKDSSGNTIVTNTYDAAGRLTQKALLNNTFALYAYDDAGHLTGLTNYVVSGGVTNVLCGYTYGYDDAGNRKYVKRSTGRGDVYRYDAADQLTNVIYDATTPDGTPGAGTNQTVYVIDAAGNWSSVTNIIPGTSTNSTTYTVNNLNQYTNIGGQTYYYTNGNYWENSSNSFFYDYESRLVCSFVGGVTITNTYDVLGRHVGRKHSAIWTRYYYAGWQLIEERDRLGNVAANYVYGAGLDEPIRMARNGTNYYYHTDGLGSITAITDGNGTLIEQYSYDVYGLPTVYDGNTNVLSGSAISNPWLFQGRYWEPDALLYNYRYRYYHPGMGRFVQVDPIGVAGGLNLYEFVNCNPVNLADPSGLGFWGDFGNGLNNTASAIGQSIGQGVYDLTHWRGPPSRCEWRRISKLMYSVEKPEYPAATPYIVGALTASGMAVAAAAAAVGSEVVASRGSFKLSQHVLNQTAGRGERYWSEIAVRQAFASGPRLSNFYGENLAQRLYNGLTTFSYGVGEGNVVLNWVTRTVVHYLPYAP